MAKAVGDKGETKKVRADNYVVYALSKANNSVAYITTITDAIVSIVKEGNIPKGSKYEDFINKLRIPGVDISGVTDLPDGLYDKLSLNSLFSKVGGDAMDAWCSIRVRVTFLHGREWVLGALHKILSSKTVGTYPTMENAMLMNQHMLDGPTSRKFWGTSMERVQGIFCVI